LIEHDLFGKPVSTFPDHALVETCQVVVPANQKAARDLRPDGLADVVPTAMQYRFPSSASESSHQLIASRLTNLVSTPLSHDSTLLQSNIHFAVAPLP
jgi:hypothetical protein